jgi:hypothetical protein
VHLEASDEAIPEQPLDAVTAAELADIAWGA